MERKRSRREFLQLLGAGAGSVVLAACVAPPATAPAGETGGQPEVERVQLRVSHWWGDRLNNMMENFGEGHPDVALSPEPKPWDGYHDALLTQLAGGVAADVYLVSMAYFPQIVRKNAFRALDEYMEADSFDPAATFVIDPSLAYGYEGALYGVDAWMPGSVYIVCNVDLFNAAGIEVPRFGTEAFDTWKFSDLREAATALTKQTADGQTEQWGLSNPGSWQDCNNQYGWQNGGEWFNTPNYQDETECIINSPEMIEAYEFLVNMHFEDHVTPTASQSELLGDNIFLSGKIAMVHTWAIYQDFADAPFEWTLIPIPWQTQRASKIGGGNNWSIHEGTEAGDAAWSFVKFVTTDEAAFEALVHTVMPPSQPDRFFDLLEPKEREVWEIQLSRSKMEYWKPANWGSRAPQRYNDIYVAWMDRVYQGEVSVEEALNSIAQETNEVINQLIAESGS